MTNIAKAHHINLLTLRKLDAVCKKYNITYFIDSGTLIGAVRHHDFIPWDDDVDVAFRRSEFEKILKVPEEEWGEGFRIYAPWEVAPGHFLDFTWRLMCMEETVPLKTYDKADGVDPKLEDRLGIDFFIMDDAYPSKFRQLILRLRLTAIYGLSMGHRGNMDFSEYNGMSGLVVRLLSKIGKKKELKRLYERYDRISRKGPENSDALFYSNYPITLLWVPLKKEDFSETVPMEIDGEYFPGPAGFDRVLRAQYGDYMELPSEEKRVNQHILPDEF